jgi:P-type E1-E2 ATPase
MSRAARAGVILKGSAVVEGLGRARTILLDKTGTITTGTPEVRSVRPAGALSERELLRLVGSLEQMSPHVTARALVDAARRRGLTLSVPTETRETPGRGIRGRVDGRDVVAGAGDWLSELGIDGAATGARVEPGEAAVVVAVDGGVAGTIALGDRLRDDAPELVRRLRAGGVSYVALVTGDRTDVGERIGRRLGVDRVYAEQTPEEKVEVVRSVMATPAARTAVMIGDGINDAPALAAADVGVAMGGSGATVSSEVADAVVLVDRVDRVGDAVEMSRRALRIAHQSIVVGLGLSFAGMIAAAFGLLPPVAGALAQEAIDVAVILNALRALRGGPATARTRRARPDLKR